MLKGLRAEIARLVCEQLKQLEKESRAAGLDTLAYLLEVAMLEAQSEFTKKYQC